MRKIAGTSAHLGIDESGHNEVIGWTAMCLDPAQHAIFQRQAEALCHVWRIRQFHGRRYRPSSEDSFAEFLTLINRTATVAPVGLATMDLFPAGRYQGIQAEVDAVISAVIGRQRAKLNAGQHKAIVRCFRPLWWLAERVGKLLPSVQRIEVFIAQSKISENLPDTVSIPGDSSVPDVYVVERYKTEDFLRLLYVGWVKVAALHAPQLDRVTFVDARASALVQAADVVGNFALSDIACMIAPAEVSKRQRAKADVFRKAFPAVHDFDHSHLAFRSRKLVCLNDRYVTNLTLAASMPEGL